MPCADSVCMLQVALEFEKKLNAKYEVTALERHQALIDLVRERKLFHVEASLVKDFVDLYDRQPTTKAPLVPMRAKAAPAKRAARAAAAAGRLSGGIFIFS